MEFSEQVVAVISECVVKVVKQLLADYNTQLNNKLKNIKITGDQIKPLTISGENIASGAIAGSNIADGAITGNNIAQGAITNINIQDGTIDSAKINNLSAVVANILAADIDWASIENLEAATIETSKATIQDAKIDWAQINEADIKVGNITDAKIQSADITFGQVKDFVGGTALISRGVAGEFYIEKLQVKQANMASIEAGQIVLRDAEGILHELYVADSGNVEARVIEVNTSNIGNGVITGDKIAAGAVTDEQINAAAIFGNKGVVEELLVGVGTFGDIFANEAIVAQLKTHLITSDYLKIHIQDTVEIGATNLVKLSNTPHSSSDFIIASYEFGDSPPQDGELVTIRIKGTLGSGKTCFNITNSGESVNIGSLKDLGDGTYGASSIVWNTKYTDAEGNEYSVDNSHILVRVLEESVTGVASSIEWIMVERGTQASDWSPAPEDISDTTDQLEGKINSVAQQIMTPEQIVTTVRSDARYNGDLQQLQTTVTQSNSALELRISKAESNLDTVSETVNETKSNLDTWYHFGADALTIGKSDSEYKTRQSNEKYEFLYSGSPVASLSGDIFEAPKMYVSDEFRFGGLCAVVDKTTGDIEWVWRGLSAAAASAFSLR